MTQFKQAKKDGKTAYFSRAEPDKLFIDGVEKNHLGRIYSLTIQSCSFFVCFFFAKNCGAKPRMLIIKIKDCKVPVKGGAISSFVLVLCGYCYFSSLFFVLFSYCLFLGADSL